MPEFENLMLNISIKYKNISSATKLKFINVFNMQK